VTIKVESFDVERSNSAQALVKTLSLIVRNNDLKEIDGTLSLLVALTKCHSPPGGVDVWASTVNRWCYRYITGVSIMDIGKG
jgi:hypothetical protein